ncbi:MAG: tetratricopeptide repeat protein [Porticoccaceae bacterium]|nr:tetratricopeptide repeat protein [Porticoccaceae bacterium]
MADHLSEEEQIEAFKQWWVDNGLKLVAAAVIAIGGTLSWQGWQDSQQQYAEEGSAIYTAMIDVATTEADQPLSDDQQQQINATADQLKEQYGDSGYAHLAALLKAKLAVNADNLDQAASELEWVINNGPSADLKGLAILRLARVEAARGNTDKALAILGDQDAGKMTSVYEEAKGDFHISLGHYEAAYTAYQTAIDTEESGNTRQMSILRLKMSQAKPENDTVETQGDS